MLQQLIIAILVLCAAGYVAWSFMSMSRRQWLLDLLAARGIGRGWADSHRKRLLTPSCGNCAASSDHIKDGRR
jgi:uncharacterized membrane protein YjgN (DUF898 family)